tara:strand:+ start:427 stop:1326 length:900 start_codon:yes stop_codon:yes gene_type:complete
MYVKEHCEPKDNQKINENDEEYSCIPGKLLLQIAKLLNDKKKSSINIDQEFKGLQEDISKEIHKYSKCSTEACWSTYDLIKDNLSSNDFNNLKDKFRPFLPDEWYKEPNKWLSTIDINKVLRQYEKNYPRFKYTGATPIDFNLKSENNVCIVNELCKIDLKEVIEDKKECIGMVFNTDPHNKSGQHWFSMFIDIKGENRKNVPTIYYFDSVINAPSQNIFDLIKLLQEQGRKLGINFEVLFNDIRHQYEDTECGVYSIHFIVSMLKGSQFEEYINNKIKDKEMEKFRKIFFIPIKDHIK